MMSSSSESGRMKKGAVNVADDWIGGLQEPNGLNCPQGASLGPDRRRCSPEGQR
jgi:hypothetical protein